MMLILYCFFLFGCVNFNQAAKLKNLPNTFTRCKSTDTNYEDCMTKAVENAFFLLKDGIPSLGVPSLDPLAVTEIQLSQKGAGSVQMALTLRNITFHGFGDTQFSKVTNGIRKADGSGDVNLIANGLIPEVQVLGDYTILGKILVLPISGQGKCNITMRKIQLKANMTNEIIKKDGEEYLQVINFQNDINPAGVQFQFDNLFNGDAVYGREMNRFLNENYDVVYGEMKPVVEDAFGEVCKQISNQLFSKVPYKNIFL